MPGAHVIIAIDPGPTESGIVLLTRGKVRQARILPNERLRDALGRLDHELIKPLCAIEMVESFGMPVGREIFDTVLWVGRYCERWRMLTGAEPALISRREVKLHLCGSARAKDPHVRQALIDKLGAAGTKKSPGPCYGVHGHLWAALAVAVTYAETKGAV
jgi:hypothetical protein